jgi:hypothetical protein
MIVDDAARGGFNRRGERFGGLRHIGIDEFLKSLSSMACHDRREHQKHACLSLTESMKQRNERGAVGIDLPLDDGWRMGTRRREVDAV